MNNKIVRCNLKNKNEKDVFALFQGHGFPFPSTIAMQLFVRVINALVDNNKACALDVLANEKEERFLEGRLQMSSVSHQNYVLHFEQHLDSP